MEYRKFGDTYMIRFDLGEEILTCLKSFCEKEQIRLASVEALGAADYAAIGVYDLENKVYMQEELHEFMEITGLTGNVTRMNGEVYLHLHGTMADRNHRVHGGHVNALRVGATCEMFVRTLDGEVGRKRNEDLGINTWSFEKKKQG